MGYDSIDTIISHIGRGCLVKALPAALLLSSLTPRPALALVQRRKLNLKTFFEGGARGPRRKPGASSYTLTRLSSF
jgi:hypothetical protein